MQKQQCHSTPVFVEFKSEAIFARTDNTNVKKAERGIGVRGGNKSCTVNTTAYKNKPCLRASSRLLFLFYFTHFNDLTCKKRVEKLKRV